MTHRTIFVSEVLCDWIFWAFDHDDCIPKDEIDLVPVLSWTRASHGRGIELFGNYLNVLPLEDLYTLKGKKLFIEAPWEKIKPAASLYLRFSAGDCGEIEQQILAEAALPSAEEEYLKAIPVERL